jgi:diguanylate cyclase (GGDEF)-like protein/PAS domain S-box-containing protein
MQIWEDTEFRLAQIVESNPLPTFVLGMDHTVTHWNSACVALTGLEPEQMIGTRDAWRAFYPEPRPVLANLVIDGADEDVVRTLYGAKVRPSDRVPGGWEVFDRVEARNRWLTLIATPLFGLDGSLVGAVETVRDISSDKYYEFELHYRATHDQLTGLPNRALLMDRLDHALRLADRAHRPVGVVCVGLDGFKLVNEGLGHPTGDHLLKEVAERLRACVRDGDTVARFCGDEFVILAEQTSRDALTSLAERCLATIAVPFQVEGHESFLTASVGLAFYPDDGATVAGLLNRAEGAMHRVKARHRGGYLFSEESAQEDAARRVAIRSALVKALERQEFSLHFQPKGHLRDGRITGFEALLRWTHPTLGSVPPAIFIPMLEETGHIVEIGDWVIGQAVAEALRWRESGLTVAVNLSARQLWKTDLPLRIARAFAKHDAPPDCLELEITESMLMRDPDQAVQMLKALHAMGVRLALDDFGTGYSSLSYLKRFPISTIKVDRSFVSDITTNRDDLEIVRAIVTLGHSLGRKIVAEGVETEEQRHILADLGCDEIQGWLLSRPMPADALERFMRQEGPRLGPA